MVVSFGSTAMVRTAAAAAAVVVGAAALLKAPGDSACAAMMDHMTSSHVAGVSGG